MKDKNLLADIENKSLEELNNLANKIIDNLEQKGLEEFIQDYQELIQLNNFIEKKFKEENRLISIKTKNKIDDMGIFLNAVNFFLKKHPVSILNIKKRSNSFHARHSAKERVYKYFIINRHSSLALDKNKAWHIKKKLDVKLMKKGATILKGTHNFTTFRASNCQAKSPIKTLKKPLISKSKNKIIFTFQSKSFLQQQVRSMVGSLKYLGEGKWKLKDFKKAFKSKKRSMCAPPAPAHGLYLVKVKY